MIPIAILVFVTSLLQFCRGADFPQLHVDTESHQIVDSGGRIRLFHGVNFVAKQFPWYHAGLLQENYAQDLASWGFNVVRLGTMWSGLEPIEGAYNQTYVDTLLQIVDNFAKYGIWVVLDMHQDVAAEEFGTYDGLPAWLTDKLRENSERKFPWPLAKIESWFCGYVAYETCYTFQRFYDNEYGAVDKLASVWRYIAQNFGGRPNIIGYNILNEPWAGNTYKDGKLQLPGEVGRKNLAPMYEKVNKAIREVDESTLLFWEPATWAHWAPEFSVPAINNLLTGFFRRRPTYSWLSGLSSACGALNLNVSSDDAEFCQGLRGRSIDQSARVNINECFAGGTAASEAAAAGDSSETAGGEAAAGDSSETGGGEAVFGSGFPTVPGGQEFQNRSVLSWHYYFPLLVYETQTYPWYLRKFAHQIFGPTVFKGAASEIRRVGGAQFLTEFGICVPDVDRPESWGSVECNWILEMADKNSLSWIYWDTSNLGTLWNAIGEPKISVASALSRPYPRAVAGSNPKFSFSTNTRVFELEFQATSTTTDATEVYLPPLTYGSNPEIRTSPDIEHQYLVDEHVLMLRLKTGVVPGSSSWMLAGSPDSLSAHPRLILSWPQYILSFFSWHPS